MFYNDMPLILSEREIKILSDEGYLEKRLDEYYIIKGEYVGLRVLTNHPLSTAVNDFKVEIKKLYEPKIEGFLKWLLNKP